MKINVNKNQKIYLFAGILLIAFLAFFTFRLQTTLQLSAGTVTQGQVLGQSIENLRGETVVSEQVPRRKTSNEINYEAVKALAFAVIDENTHNALLEKEPHLSLPIASLTKLMTTLLAYENLKPEEFIQVRGQDALNISPSLYLAPGSEVKVQNLIEATIVCSANDAGRTLANETTRQTGKAFITEMNSRAKTLGMSETHYSNPLGFDSLENYSTVSDLKILVGYSQSLAIFKNLSKSSSLSFEAKTGELYACKATNKLVGKNLEIEAIKTGYTLGAKGAMVARVVRNGHKIIVIILGSEDREQDLLTLAELAFDNYVWE